MTKREEGRQAAARQWAAWDALVSAFGPGIVPLLEAYTNALCAEQGPEESMQSE